MADWPLEVEPMRQENEGHTCIYAKDEGDRNFKVCIQCGRIAYRTDEELLTEYGNEIEKRIRGNDDGA